MDDTLLAYLAFIALLTLLVWLFGKLVQMPKPDPREIVAITLPILAEVVAVVPFIGMIATWIAVGATRPI